MRQGRGQRSARPGEKGWKRGQAMVTMVANQGFRDDEESRDEGLRFHWLHVLSRKLSLARAETNPYKSSGAVGGVLIYGSRWGVQMEIILRMGYGCDNTNRCRKGVRGSCRSGPERLWLQLID